jgi:hypothetical protein
MKRLRTLLAGVFWGSMIAGCGESGITPGSPTEPATSTQTSQFREAMQNKEKNFSKKKIGKKVAEPPKKGVDDAAEKAP